MNDRGSPPPIGALLDGKFKLLQEIGRGGMATVFSAENVDIGKRVAVKMLAAELASSKTVTERFMREARAAASLHSPYICEVYDVGTYSDRPFIVMELLTGESLYDKLARERILSTSETLNITSQAARGLKRAHENRIVHRDLKPENVFLASNEDGALQVKLVDFGLAKFYEPTFAASNARLTKEGALFGTPAYMSPEQARGKGNVDHRSDLWALACIVYEMLTGRTVWDIDQGVAMILAQIASNPPPSACRYRQDLAPEFDAWLAQALARNPDQRFQSTDEFVATLERAFAASPARPVARGSASSAPAGALRRTPPSNPPPLPSQVHTPPPPSAGEQRKIPTPPSRPAAPAPTPRPTPESSAGWPPPSTPPSGDPEHSRRDPHFWRWSLLGLVAGASLVGAALFLKPQLGAWIRRSTSDAPMEQGAAAEEIARGQGLLLEHQAEPALVAFRAAFDAGQSKAARSFLAHASVAVESTTGPCRLQGIGHPRPFDATGDSSKPTATLTRHGLLVAWADGKAEDRVRTQLTFLDGALRRVRDVTEVTPETASAREPEIFDTKQGLGMLYWDSAGERPGVYTRALDERGTIMGAPERLSSSEAGHPYYPAITSDGHGGYWTVWAEPSSPKVYDLVVRKLGPDLKPVSEPVAVTGYASPKTGKTQVNRPSIALLNNLLHITYSLRRGNSQQLLLLRVPAEQALRGPGAVAASNERAVNDEEGDRFLGSVQTLSAVGNNDYPTVRCDTARCYVTWDEAKAGGHVASFTSDGAVTWHRRLSAEASRPTVALPPRGAAAVMAWYENQRVLVAPLTENGPATPSVVGRVSAALQQPPPGMLAGGDGTWFVTWRGYEAGVQEPFVAALSCQGG